MAGPYPLVLSELETLQAVQRGRSLARFGDGELKLALGRHAKSQRHDPELQKWLRAALSNPDSMCCVAIPPGPDSATPKADFWREYWGPKFSKLYRREGVYGSSWVSRPDSAPWIDNPAYWEELAKIWRGREVALVRGDGGKGLRADELEGAASVETMTFRRQHAWADHWALWEGLKHERRLVIMCLGASATAMCFRLAQRGVQAVDLGHVALFLRRRAAGEDATQLSPEDKAAP